MLYECTGITVCGYADMLILTLAEAYDRVSLGIFKTTSGKLGQRNLGSGVEGLLKRETEE